LDEFRGQNRRSRNTMPSITNFRLMCQCDLRLAVVVITVDTRWHANK
jgi:hypothetical protein